VKTASDSSPSLMTRSGVVDDLSGGKRDVVIQDAEGVTRREREPDTAHRRLCEPVVPVALDPRAREADRPLGQVERI
jgi:hypothetical protein